MRYLLVNPDDDDNPVLRVEAYAPYMIEHELGNEVQPFNSWEWLVYEFDTDTSLKFLGLLSDI